jgi:hypothetical protein
MIRRDYAQYDKTRLTTKATKTKTTFLTETAGATQTV